MYLGIHLHHRECANSRYKYKHYSSTRLSKVPTLAPLNTDPRSFLTMGNQQSSAEGAGSADNNSAPAARKTCYYELLGVDRTADDLEIRRAYKKKALELHPDRNFNDEERATRRFAEVQTAYEILSDPQERAWYDSHRDAILRGDDDAADASPEFNNVRVTTTEDIMTLIGRFNSNVPFNDSPTGFFGVLDATFAKLAAEEAEWSGFDPVDYPPFGNANDDHTSTARPFYAAWSNFSTKKSFSWKDKWRLTDAPDRAVRRLMEKENKKLREDAIRDFNDAIRSLVAFVKKRDPRYVTNTQSEADRQKTLRDLAAAQAARSRAANQEKLNATEPFVAGWAQSREDEVAHDEFATSTEDEESEVECFECVVCNKVFKSEKQFEAHEKSKKHIKAVQQLRRQMRKEGRDLDLDVEAAEPAGPKAGKPPSNILADQEEDSDAVDMEDAEEQAGQAAVGGSRAGQPRKVQEPNDESASASSLEDCSNDEYAARDVVQKRLTPNESESKANIPGDGNALVSQITSVTLEEEDQEAEKTGPGSKKKGKAKDKRAKRAAKQPQARDSTVSLSYTHSEKKLLFLMEGLTSL